MLLAKTAHTNDYFIERFGNDARHCKNQQTALDSVSNQSPRVLSQDWCRNSISISCHSAHTQAQNGTCFQKNGRSSKMTIKHVQSEVLHTLHPHTSAVHMRPAARHKMVIVDGPKRVMHHEQLRRPTAGHTRFLKVCSRSGKRPTSAACQRRRACPAAFSGCSSPSIAAVPWDLNYFRNIAT